MNPVRCFVAAALPREVQEDLGRLQERLSGLGVRARWVKPDSLHLTVKFLGELEPPRFQEVAAALGDPLPETPCRVEPRGLGTFPPSRRARVLWVGLSGDAGLLARAALTVEARLEPVGIERERRPFRPHLTLARARGREGIRGVEKALDREGSYTGPDFIVDRFILYESRLRPEGAQHIPRLTVPLEGGNPVTHPNGDRDDRP